MTAHTAIEDPAAAKDEDPTGESNVELSVVMPCLNEADTLSDCIQIAKDAIRKHGIAGEIIIADNGSTDGSLEIARSHGVRVVEVAQRGYGAALMDGIDAAAGKYIIMGDADLSYDFSEIPALLAKLRQGFDLVQGCRLPSGGGSVMPGAMPWLHRHLGNPLFSRLARWWFKAPVHDVYCGLRGFTKSLYHKIDSRCTGMEFAVEMIVKASFAQARIAEHPITLRPDGRKNAAPHLKTFRDGWRTLRFFLLCAPRWLFLLPGVLMMLLGVAGYALALPGLSIAGITFDAHTLLVASLALICGFQAVVFWVVAKTISMVEGLMGPDQTLSRIFSAVDVEKGIVIAFVAIAAGVVMLTLAVNEWRMAGFGPLDYAHTMRLVIPGSTLIAMGFQALFSSFLVSILAIHRR